MEDVTWQVIFAILAEAVKTGTDPVEAQDELLRLGAHIDALRIPLPYAESETALIKEQLTQRVS